MHKIFLSVTSMIFTHFVMKVVSKVKHPEQFDREEIYRAAKAEHERWLRERQPKRPVAEVDARLMRGDPSAALASIGTVADIEATLRPYRSPDQGDAMAMAPGRFS